MGAWAVGSFGNDYALDWLYEVCESRETDRIEQALTAVLDAPAGALVDADDCVAAIAAAEFVAAARGCPSEDLPREAARWVKKNLASVDPSLVDLSLCVLRRIRSRSELKSLWDDSAHAAEWYRVVEELEACLSGKIAPGKRPRRRERKPKHTPNMRVLKKSRKPPKPGDIFVLHVREGEYVFGRVVRVGVSIGGFDDLILIYLYNAFGSEKHRIPKLDKRNLLVPPLATDVQPWRDGYFENVGHEALAVDDVWPRHCFEDPARRGMYFDDNGRELPQRFEPCGKYAYTTCRGIDGKVSAALGLPVAGD